MKCPVCEYQGIKSTVYEVGMVGTLMTKYTWYDEDGNAHFHDPNTYTTRYTCSNGHRFSFSHAQKYRQ